MLNKIAEYCKDSSEFDRKLETLRDIIIKYRTSTETKNKKILIFSYYKDTINYLFNSLREELETEYSTRVGLIFGGTSPSERTKKVRHGSKWKGMWCFCVATTCKVAVLLSRMDYGMLK